MPITIFGTDQCEPGSWPWQQAEEIVRQPFAWDTILVTGGGSGVAQAVANSANTVRVIEYTDDMHHRNSEKVSVVDCSRLGGEMRSEVKHLRGVIPTIQLDHFLRVMFLLSSSAFIFVGNADANTVARLADTINLNQKRWKFGRRVGLLLPRNFAGEQHRNANDDIMLRMLENLGAPSIEERDEEARLLYRVEFDAEAVVKWVRGK